MDFYGVAWFGDTDSFQDFIDRHGLTFPQMDDDRGNVFAHFEIVGQPALVVIDAAGATQTLLGALDEDALARQLTAIAPA